MLLDNQLYFDKCSNHAFYSTPSASGVFVYSDEGYSVVNCPHADITSSNVPYFSSFMLF